MSNEREREREREEEEGGELNEGPHRRGSNPVIYFEVPGVITI